MKSVLWRLAKRLSYIEDARCLKVKHSSVGNIPHDRNPGSVTMTIKSRTVLYLSYISFYLLRMSVVFAQLRVFRA